MKFSLKELTLDFLNRTLRSGSYRGDNTSFWRSLAFGSESYSGVSVSQDTALTYVAYWACVRLLSETLASLPFIVYRRTGDRGKARAYDHPLYTLLHDEPNPEMDSFSFFETLMYHLAATDGNGYVYIDFENDLTTIKHLWLMRPDKIELARNDKGEIVYKYQFADGQRTIPAFRVWHIPGLGYDGLQGYTPLTLVRQAVGLGLATEKMGAKFFGNGMALGGVLEHPGKMSDDAQARLKRSMAEKHEGLDNAHKWIVLEEGLKAQKQTITPEESQFLETRKFQKGDLASFFHVPPHMIGDLERATFSNIEEQSLEFVVYTMRPWLVRFERSAKRKLFSPAEKNSMFCEFLVDGLLRGDIESRYRAYAIGRNWGWLSANDVLAMENRNGIGKEGDIYMAPQNMIPADQFGQTLPAKPPKPAAPSGDDQPTARPPAIMPPK